MKRLLLGFVVLWSIGLQAQVGPCSIEGGEQQGELYFNIDILPDFYNLGSASANNIWSFTTLQSPRTITYRYEEVGSARFFANFPEAMMVLKDPRGKEVFYDRIGNEWYEIGYVTYNERSASSKIVHYSVPIKACVPSIVDKSYTYQTEINIDEKEVVSYRDIKDASGVLYLPDEIYDAYRTQREITTNVNGSLNSRLSYLFTDQITGEMLMEVRMDQYGAPNWIRYKSKEPVIDDFATTSTNQFLLYPNTSYGEVRLEFRNFVKGKYFFVIHDIVGRELWRSDHFISQDVTLKEDLSFLPRGTYTYTILDDQQNRLVTRRLAIIKS